MKVKNVAVVLAAGCGKRFGSGIPKQYIRLGGKKIIEYTLAAFELNPNIDEICVVINLDFQDDIKKIIAHNGFKKLNKIIGGGIERYDSSYNAIKAYENEKNIQLIFHDAVRPFISQRIINDTLNALQHYDAVDVAIASADTIIEITKENLIASIPNRNKLRRGQTPQGFKLEIIKKAHETARALDKPIEFTDDCGMVKVYLPNTPVYVVEGEDKNIKITQKEDLLLAEKLLQLHTERSSYNKNLLDLKDKNIVIFGSSSGIGKAIYEQLIYYKANVHGFNRSNGYDVRNEADVRKALAQITSDIDYIINTAGVLLKKNLTDYTKSEVDDLIDINLKGSIAIARAAFEPLRKSSGMLLLFTSSSYTRGRSQYSLYSASKSAIVNLTQALDEEWEGDHIRINCINPARTLTPMRTKNFGYEEPRSLLLADEVAHQSLQILLQNVSGQVIDIKKDI